MLRRLLLYAFSFLIFLPSFFAQEIPDQMEFCDIQLTFDAGTKEKLLAHVRQIQSNPRYFNQLVKRSHIYLPFVFEAFDDLGVPRDLSYLAIQESALRADANSSSQAAGFWPLEIPTAEELGLIVNDKIDERKHIFRSSVAAANYLLKANQRFDNWVYASLCFNEDFIKGISYSDSSYYGKKEMTITNDDHWYIIKMLAHKIAYSDAINEREQPEIFLLPFSSQGEVSIKALIAKHNMKEAQFFAYNKWVLNSKKLPRGQNFTYYVPQSGMVYFGHKPDPNKNVETADTISPVLQLVEKTIQKSDTPAGAISQPLPVDPNVYIPKAVSNTMIPASEQIVFNLRDDLHYGVEYCMYDGSKIMAQLANEYQMSLSDLLVWNNLIPGQEPPAGSLIFLVKPSRATFHIVKKGESLSDIANMHLISFTKLQNRNRMNPDDFTIYIGQKLYIKSHRPKDEKPIILIDKVNVSREEDPPPAVTPTISENQPSPPQEQNTRKPDQLPAQTSDPEVKSQNSDSTVETRWVRHVVNEGETLQQISQLYEIDVDLIKQINKLESDEISPGQVLRLLVRKN